KRDRGPLRRRKILDRLPQRLRITVPLAIYVRSFIGKSYKYILNLHLVSHTPAIPPRPIDQPVPRNRHEPRHERTPRVVAGADRVQRYQYVLHKIFNVFSAHKAALSTDDLPQARRDLLQHPDIGLRVARLRGLHQCRESLIIRLPLHRRSIYVHSPPWPNTWS